MKIFETYSAYPLTMKIQLALLLLVAASLVAGEQCGGHGRHIELRVGPCSDTTSDRCSLPTDSELSLTEDFVLSKDLGRVRITAEAITSLGVFPILTMNLENLVGGVQYRVSQDIVLGPQLVGQSGTFVMRIHDFTDVTDLEICSVLPDLSFE